MENCRIQNKTPVLPNKVQFDQI